MSAPATADGAPALDVGIMTVTTHHDRKKPRTLILCFDGTADQYAGQNTNVVKLYSLFKKEDESEQLCYYQPGIGTYFNDGAVSPFLQWGAKILDQGVAWYLDAHVRGGYQFLMQNYSPGDKICLFGFSRGAYTARALAGMLHKIGLLPKDNPEQIPFAYKMYKLTDPQSVTLAVGFKRTFCREVKIEFVGVWDTVASVGNLVSRTLPFIANNTTIKTFRHALALDEHRAKFRPNLYHRPDLTNDSKGKTNLKENVVPVSTAEDAEKSRFKSRLFSGLGSIKSRLTKKASKRASTGADWTDVPSAAAELRWCRGSEDSARFEKLESGTDVYEVWFAGCHADVGGSAVPDEAKFSLSDISLHWMIRQIVLAQCGIIFDHDALMRAGISDSVLIGFPLTPTLTHEKHALFPVLHHGHAGEPSRASEDTVDEKVRYTEGLEKQHALQPMHDQLKMIPLWWLLEILPTSYNWQERNGRWHTSWSLHRGKGRHLPPMPNFHVTVQERMKEEALHYHPRAIWKPDSEVYVE